MGQKQTTTIMHDHVWLSIIVFFHNTIDETKTVILKCSRLKRPSSQSGV